MSQLVGQRCLLCSDVIHTILDGEFCSSCARAVHHKCKSPDNQPNSAQHCSACGGDPSRSLSPDFGFGQQPTSELELNKIVSWAAAQPEPMAPASEHFTELDPLPKHPESRLSHEPIALEANIRRSDHGETLAVLALLLPLVAQSIALACRFDSLGIGLALGWGTILVTAILLAVDAACLGTTDLQGTQRGGPGLLALGVILLWIVCYPVAFFRRRHFGRPNLGPLAILVALFFVAAPFVQQYMAFGVFAGDVPSCTSREVIGMVNDIIRKTPLGPSVRSISGHREISFDAVSQTRKGQCLVKTENEAITATYTVKIVNRANGTFQVDVDPIISADPPACNDAEVITLVERIIRDGPNGHLLRKVAGHEEIRYDQETKTRHGRCRVTMRDWTGNVAYRVYWLDQKTGRYQVDVEP